MPCHYEAISTLRPFDDPDAVRQSGDGASPARSWQHGVARAIMAYLLDALSADSQFERYTPEQRLLLVYDLERLVDTYDDDRAGVVDRIFDRLFTDAAVEQDIRHRKTQHEIHVMMDDCYQLIDGNHQPLKRL